MDHLITLYLNTDVYSFLYLYFFLFSILESVIYWFVFFLFLILFYFSFTFFLLEKAVVFTRLFRLYFSLVFRTPHQSIFSNTIMPFFSKNKNWTKIFLENDREVCFSSFSFLAPTTQFYPLLFCHKIEKIKNLLLNDVFLKKFEEKREIFEITHESAS